MGCSEELNNQAEQAAIAGASVIISEKKKAIENFEDNPDSEEMREHHGDKTFQK